MFNNDYNVSVAIDFGSTSSGASFAILNDGYSFDYDDDELPPSKVIKNWAKQSALLPTIPTVVAYRKSNQQPIGIGNVQGTPQIYLVEELPQLLITGTEPSHFKPVADFLKLFCDHVTTRIQQGLHNRNLKLNVRYCFTLQHPNEPHYKNNLLDAIIASGIYTESDRDDKIMFVDTYAAMSKYVQINNFSKVDNSVDFIICDADEYYMTIKTMKFDPSKPRDTEQSQHITTDRSLGGISIDSKFKEYVLKLLKIHPDHVEDEEQDLLSTTDIISQNFIKNIKYKDFGNNEEIYITIPSVKPSTNSDNSYLTIKIPELKEEVYDPVVNGICDKVKTIHEDSGFRTFFLIGKLSNLGYLNDKLSSIVDNVTVVPEKNLAALQGAVFFGLKQPLSVQRVVLINNGIEKLKTGIDRSYYDFSYQQYTHVIGIDFGTSFSKWYYASINEKEEPAVFIREKMQIPTLSLYDHRAHELKLWGDEAHKNYYGPESSGKLLTRFKLLLNELNVEGFDEYTAVDAIARYLRALNDTILKRMETILKGQKTKFRYSLTVPTIWSDKTKKHMRDAAVMAGIIQPYNHPCRLMLVNEPEAAAMFYSKDSYLKKTFPKKASIRVLVCDAGGGTVDMATFEYIKGQDDSYTINEVMPGSGGVCGASILDDRFRKLIEDKCYEMDYYLTGYVKEQMVNQFALEIKGSFLSNTDSKNIEIRFPEIATKPNGKLEVTPEELTRQVFDPVVKDVLKLIEVQHKMSNSSSKFNSDREALDLIILTGGLGQSKYLQNRVKEKYQNIPVYTPAAYDQSVVRGAVALALNPNVATQRVASRSYGIEVMVPRDSGKSSMNQMISGLEFNSNIRYDNFVEWGTSIGTYEYYEKTFYVKYPNNTYAAIYASDFKADKEMYNVLDPRVEQVFKFDLDMPKSPNREDGEIVPVIIRMFLGQTEIKVDAIIEGETRRLSFNFKATDEKHRKEIEDLHHIKSQPMPAISKSKSLFKNPRKGSVFGFILGKRGDKE